MPRTVVWVSWRDEAGFVHSACVGGELIGDLLHASEFAETSCGLTVPSLASLGGDRPTCLVCLDGYEERLGMASAALFGAGA